MVMLVSLDEAKASLRVDHDEDDATLTLNVQAASAAVLRYLKLTADSFTDSSGEIAVGSDGESVVPEDVAAAVKVLTGIFFRDPSGMNTAAWPDGYLPLPVKNLLLPMRLPSLA